MLLVGPDVNNSAAGPEPVPCKIEGEWSIRNVEALQKLLAGQLDGSADVVLDLGAVRECDTAVLQLLCAAQKTAAGRGARWRIARLSPAIEETAAAIGLSPAEFAGSGGEERHGV